MFTTAGAPDVTEALYVEHSTAHAGECPARREGERPAEGVHARRFAGAPAHAIGALFMKAGDISRLLDR